jgi:hypothetical protein
MWAGKAMLSDLQNVKRWRVERFAIAAQSENLDSPFASVTISDVTVERLETADPMDIAWHDSPYVGLENVESNTGELIDIGTVAERGIRSRSKVFRKNDILYGRLRAYLNKVYLADETVARGLCSGEFYVLTPAQDRIAPEYLRWVLASPSMVQYVRGRLAGATHPRLGFEDLLAFKLVLPPLTEQERICAYIRSQREVFRDLRARITELPLRVNETIKNYTETGSIDTFEPSGKPSKVRARKMSR